MPSIPLYLYAIRAGDTDQVKIGVTNNPPRRLKQLQTGVPHTIQYVVLWEVHGAWGVERRVHAMLESRRIIGEWFRIPDDEEIPRLIDAAMRVPDPTDTVQSAPRTRYERRDKTMSREQLIDMLIAAEYTDEELFRLFKAKFANEVIARRDADGLTVVPSVVARIVEWLSSRFT